MGKDEATTNTIRRLLPVAAGAAVLFVAILAAYSPAVDGEFLWDDTLQVSGNPLLVVPDGLARIWFTTDSPSQYFPLSYTVLRWEFALWRLNSTGYHLLNLLIHFANALLVWAVLRRMSIRGAWLAAAIFALHPMNVESVAWIAELKNVLSTFFYLAAAWFWTGFIDENNKHGRDDYAIAFVCQILALLAKPTACTLPASLLIIAWLREGSLGRRRVLQATPFVVAGFGMGLLTLWWERNHTGTVGAEYAFAPIERLLIAGKAIWFYVAKLAWPAGLTANYPRWEIDASDPVQYVPVAVVLFVAAILWGLRKRARGACAAALFFVANLAPLIGFFSLYTFRFSFVFDHFVYVAMIGPVALLASVLARERARGARIALSAVILGVLSALTWNHSHAFTDAQTLWTHTLARNPRSWMAHRNLGSLAMSRDDPSEALQHYRAANRLRGDADGWSLLSAAEYAAGETQRAAEAGLRSVELGPTPEGHYNAALALQEIGRIRESEKHARAAVRLAPRWPDARDLLGGILLQQRKIDDAINEFDQALRLNPNHSSASENLERARMIRGDL